MSPHHYFAIFLFVINAAAATVASISKQEALNATNLVDFDLKLDVDKLTNTSYQKFIDDLRAKAKDPKSSSKDPILPSYDKDVHLFDVVLTTGNRQVTTVRIRRDNLYVRGYLMETPKKWMEFTADKNHMVDPNSIPLEFGDSYEQMESAANAQVMNILFTKEALKDAIIKLSKSKDKKEQAKSLIFMSQMISEAARFLKVSSFFGSQLDRGQHLPPWMRPLQNDWGKFSKVVQCYDKYKEKYKYKKVTIDNIVYETPDQLRSIFGVMLKERNLNDKTCGIKKLADGDEGEATVVLTADI